jgi:type II secretory pathway pseudopilin PulG
VIVVIGLLASAVLTAQSLINSAKIRSQISQLTKYDTAISAFKLEYDGLPGDFDEAEDYALHQDKDGVINTCFDRQGVTYNGNGDNILDDGTSAGITTHSYEIKNFYIHLANADLLDQSINREVSSHTCTAPSINSGISYPKSELDGGLITVSSGRKLYHIIGGAGEERFWYLNYNIVGYDDNTRPLSREILARNNLTVHQARIIDEKVDDGIPLKGNAVIIQEYEDVDNGKGSSTGRIVIDSFDHDQNCVFNGEYNLRISDEKACTLAVKSESF